MGRGTHKKLSPMKISPFTVVYDLTTDVNTLKQKGRERERRWNLPSHFRSRSPRCSSCCEHSRWSSGEGCLKSWADRDPEEKANYSAILNFSNEEDGVEGSQLMEVS